jgi:hypothetical protein
MRLTRQCFTRLLATLPASHLLSPPPALALFGEVIPADGFTQADDKSWDLTLPSSAWRFSGASPRAEFPTHLFRLQAERSGKEAAAFDLTVDITGAKSNSDIGGSAQLAGEKLMARVPRAVSLESAVTVPGTFPTANGREVMKGSAYYVCRYNTEGGGTAVLKVKGQQGRTYTLAVTLPQKPSAELQAEAELLIESFKTFPVNIICQTQSSSGTVPVAGSCY